MGCMKSLAIPLRGSQMRSPAYLAQLRGTIDQAVVLPYAAEVNPFRDFPDRSSTPDLHAGDLIYVRAQLTNRGDQPWFGVPSALIGGETRLRAQWLGQGQLGSEHQLMVLADRVAPGQSATEIKLVTLPEISGAYQLKLDLILEEIGDFPDLDGSSYGVNLGVQNPGT